MIKMLPVIELIRLEEDALINKRVFCATLEPADLENVRDRSSIPVQQYVCVRRSTPTYPNTFEVMAVPGRSLILFHAGNLIGDTAGCILLGEHFGKLRGARAILNSGKTFTAFMLLLDDYEKVHLTIREVF